ncbi:MAG: 1-acyl-sn-glycerol-3-phosphate acyltransferase [Microbacteriaceae bacterium]|nr:1-acyl-sn-glycerol-3-phosphate acyltransferase [Microbacteriaceae bacterium]
MGETPSAGTRSRSEKTLAFRLLAALVVPPTNLAVRFRFRNREKLPVSGAFILAPNHYSEIDPIVMGVAMWKLGRMPRFMAKASLFTVPVLGQFMRATDQIPVARSGASRDSDPLAAARVISDKGLAVVIYPEGSLTRDPELWPMRGKAGAVRMALQTGIPIIPAAHWGTQKLMPRYGKRINAFPRKTIDVIFGDPVDLSAFVGRARDAATLTEATAVVMAEITALLETLRDEKAPPERWDPSKNQQSETGRF